MNQTIMGFVLKTDGVAGQVGSSGNHVKFEN